MNPVLYQLNGELPADKYLAGQYQWATPVQITTALLDCQKPPTSGTLTIILEVGGILSVFRFTVAAGTMPLAIPQAVNVLVPANAAVRWRASFAGGAEAAAAELSITLQVVPQSVSQVTAVPPKLTVQWVNQRERLTLYNYSADTKLFTETSPGISSGRASIGQNGLVSSIIGIGATTVMTVAAQVVSAAAFIALGGVATPTMPRLIFCVDGVPVATLSADGLRVVDLTEDTPLALAPSDAGYYSRFEFYSGGVLTAVLGATGMTALGLGEFP